ncbi:MAG: HNH endonuclease, partial [Proteobacteria bacterium]
MMLKNISNAALVSQTRKAVAVETQATTNVVRHFIEIKKRDLHLERGYSSMFLMAVKEFGYDKASAQRRVSAMELALAVPAVLSKIDRREMCLQSAADIQTFLNKERGARRAYTSEKKSALVEQCTGLSTREVQVELVKRNPSIDFSESKKLVAPDRYRISHTVSSELENKLERIKALLSHVNPFMTREELLDYLAELALEKIDPVRKAQQAGKCGKAGEKTAQPRGLKVAPAQTAKVLPSQEAKVVPAQTARVVPAQEPLHFVEEVVSEYGEIQLVAKLEDAAIPTRNRYIKTAEDHAARKRNANGGCEYVDELSGRRCGSQHQLQRDHIVSYSRGGTNTRENLQMLCAQHNR